MPTIPQLPSAQGTGAQDEIPVSQAGITREVTISELLVGTQPLLVIPSPCVLGRGSLGPGGPEPLSVGAGLLVQGATIVANGTDHTTFVSESSFAVGDEVIVNSAGMPKRLPIASLRALYTGGSNVQVSTAGVINASTDASVTGSLTNLTQGLQSTQASVSVLAAKIPVGGFASLNNNGQVTAPLAGDASLATVAVTNAQPRTMVARARDVINILDFGAVPGGSDCSAAFMAAFGKVSASSGEVFLPAGDYWLFSPLAINGIGLTLRGAGKGQTRIHLQHTGIGFDFTPGSLFNKVVVKSLSIYAESSLGATGAGMRVTYPASSSFGYVTAIIQDIELFGYPNAINALAPFPQTFLRGIVLNNCWSAQVDNVSWFGPPGPPGSTTSALVELNGSIDTRLTSVQAYYGNAFILQTGYCEGIYVNNPVVVAVDYLLLQTDETKWPGYVVGRAMLLGLWISNGEANTNLGSLQLSNVTDVFISNMDFTRDLGPNTSEVFFNLLNVSNLHVAGCNFVGGPTGGTGQDVAFQFKSNSNSSGNIVSGCHFEDMATVIQIVGPNGTVALTTFGLHIGNVPIGSAFIDPTPPEASNYISFVSPGVPGTPAGLATVKDFVISSAAGNTLLRINNVAGAANFIRHQPSTAGGAPSLCFDGTDAVVSGVIQTKGGNLSLSAAGGTSGSGNLASFTNVSGATNWIAFQNSTSSNLSQITTNAGGIGLQPKGSLWLSPSGGLFMVGLPAVKPTQGSGQIWNNSGVVSIA